MSDCWDILGIEPTKEKREVRSAYAARSKMCHMEENPEEFARLNQAYQEALAYASAGGRREPGQRMTVSVPREISDRDEAQQNKQQDEQPGSESSSSLLERLQQAEEAKDRKSVV